MKFLKDVFIAHASNSSNGAASSTAAPSTTVVSGSYYTEIQSSDWIICLHNNLLDKTLIKPFPIKVVLGNTTSLFLLCCGLFYINSLRRQRHDPDSQTMPLSLRHPCHPWYWFHLKTLLYSVFWAVFCKLTDPGRIPAPPLASEVDGDVKEEQSDDFLTDLLAQLEPPPGPSWNSSYSEFLFPSCVLDFNLWREFRHTPLLICKPVSTQCMQTKDQWQPGCRSIILRLLHHIFQRNKV